MEDDVISKEKYNEVVEKLANETQSKANLIEEIKNLREKKQITEAEAEELRAKLAEKEVTPPDPSDTSPERIAEMAAEAARKVLTERDVNEAKQNKENAFREFLDKHKEFHPDNDEGGLKRSALDRKLELFNMDGLKTREQFLSIFEDASNLVAGKQTVTDDTDANPNPLPPNGGGGSGKPREVVDDQLSVKEMKIVQETFGGDKERYLKVKAKRPEYVASLLQYLV